MLEALTAGGMSMLGSWYDNRNDTKNMREQNAFNAEQARINRDFQAGEASIDRELQRFYAENGISMRVADAVAAGLHPLVGAGVNPHQYSPVGVGGSQASSSGYTPSHMGQDVSRALIAGMSNTRAHQVKMEALAEERGELENELLRSQIARWNANPTGGLPSNSGMPALTGQGDWLSDPGGNIPAYVEERPLVRTHSQPGQPAQEVGAVTDYAFVRTPEGYAVVPSNDVKQRIEDQWIQEGLWAWRNNVKPMFSGLPAPDPKYYQLPDGYDYWKWNPWHQEFRPARSERRDGLYSRPTR